MTMLQHTSADICCFLNGAASRVRELLLAGVRWLVLDFLQEISLGGIEDLKRTIQQRQRQDPSNWAAYMPLKYLLPMVDGRGKLENIGNNRFPNIKPISMRDYLHKVGDLPEPGY